MRKIVTRILSAIAALAAFVIALPNDAFAQRKFTFGYDQPEDDRLRHRGRSSSMPSSRK